MASIYDQLTFNTLRNNQLPNTQNNSGLQWWMNKDRSRYPSPVMPSNLSQDLGASAYVPSQAIGGTDIDMQYTTGNEFNIPPRGNILSRFASGARNIYGNVKDKFSGIPSVIGGAISALAPRFSGEGKYSETFPARTFTEGDRTYTQKSLGGHYTPYEKQVMLGIGQTGEWGDPRKDEFGQNIVSFAEDHEEKLRDWVRKYGSRKSDNAKFISRQRRKNAMLRQIDERKGAAVTTDGRAVTTGGGGTFNPVYDKPSRPGERPSWREATAAREQTYRDTGGAQGQVAGPGFGRGAYWAQGGRVGYRNGEFVDEDINIQGPGFDVNENIEMAEADPFQMRIQELIDKGLSWEDAYDIAAQEFQDKFSEGPEESFSEDQGIASLV